MHDHSLICQMLNFCNDFNMFRINTNTISTNGGYPQETNLIFYILQFHWDQNECWIVMRAGTLFFSKMLSSSSSLYTNISGTFNIEISEALIHPKHIRKNLKRPTVSWNVIWSTSLSSRTNYQLPLSQGVRQKSGFWKWVICSIQDKTRLTSITSELIRKLKHILSYLYHSWTQ